MKKPKPQAPLLPLSRRMRPTQDLANEEIAMGGIPKQRIADPNEPTEDELAVLKSMQPLARRVSPSDIAQVLRIDDSTARDRLIELSRKGYAYRTTPRRSLRGSAQSARFTLTDKGIAFLVEHRLTRNYYALPKNNWFKNRFGRDNH
jgi:hypothetical protein